MSTQKTDITIRDIQHGDRVMATVRNEQISGYVEDVHPGMDLFWMRTSHGERRIIDLRSPDTITCGKHV